MYVWIKKVLFLFLVTSQKYRTTQVGGKLIRLSGPNFHGEENGGDHLVPCPIASWKLVIIGTLSYPWIKMLYQICNQMHFKICLPVTHLNKKRIKVKCLVRQDFLDLIEHNDPHTKEQRRFSVIHYQCQEDLTFLKYLLVSSLHS